MPQIDKSREIERRPVFTKGCKIKNRGGWRKRGGGDCLCREFHPRSNECSGGESCVIVILKISTLCPLKWFTWHVLCLCEFLLIFLLLFVYKKEWMPDQDVCIEIYIANNKKTHSLHSPLLSCQAQVVNPLSGHCPHKALFHKATCFLKAESLVY